MCVRACCVSLSTSLLLTPLSLSPPLPPPLQVRAKIHFSPFNGTKVIPNRSAVSGVLSPDTGVVSRLEPCSPSDDSDDSDEDWDENYVDAVARCVCVSVCVCLCMCLPRNH